MWYADALLGNDREIFSYTIAVAKQWLCKQRPLLNNGCKRHACNNRRTAGSGVFCAIRAEAIQRGAAAITSLEMVVRRAGDWCEMAASLRGLEPGNRGTSTSTDTAD
jgi:hypothetical protein